MKKVFLMMGVLVVSGLAAAASLDVVHLPATSVLVEPMCPQKSVCKRDGARVTVSFEVGCHQVLGPVVFDHLVIDSTTAHVFVSIPAVSEPADATCLAMPTPDSRSFEIESFFGDVEVHVMQ